jgi:hypothetical protein
MRPADIQFAQTIGQRFCRERNTQPASEWIEENVSLNEPKIKGTFSFKGREYLRQIVDSWGPLPESLKGAEDFIGCLATGGGKTISTIGGLAYRIANEPMRALVVKPTLDGAAGARNYSRSRFIPALEASEATEELIPRGAKRHNFSTTNMLINGSVIDFTGSNSVGQLAENRCDVTLQDEIDKYPPQRENAKEANPIYLADERTKNVSGARRYKFSTPTLANGGIWEWFLKGDQRRYFVPCPHCQKKAVLAWSKQFTVFAIRGDEAFVRWSDEARNVDGSWDLEKVVKTAHAVCPHCNGKITDAHKPEMNARGEWVATAKGAPGIVSWHLPSMYSISRDCNFGQMAKKFLLAKKSLDGVKGFINSDLAEPDVSQGISVNRSGIVGKHIEVTGEWLKILSLDYHAQAPYFWSVVGAWNGTDEAHIVEYDSFNNWYEIDEKQAEHKIIKEAVILDAGHEQAEVTRECCQVNSLTRCSLAEAVQDGVPEVIGWQPAKSFGGNKLYRVVENESVLYQPFRKDKFIDPFVGTELARQMKVSLLEFLENPFEDMLQNIIDGKTGLKWSISKEADTDEFHKQMAAKVKKPWKKNPRDLRWQTIPNRDDHIRLCCVLQLVLAVRLQLISFQSLQVVEQKEQK